MSDGCSVNALPRVFAFLAAPATDAQRRACIAHDRDYYYGGTPRDRRMADAVFVRRSVAAGSPEWKVFVWWCGLRLFGGPRLHRLSTWALGRPQAWAWGGSRFRYSNTPEGGA